METFLRKVFSKKEAQGVEVYTSIEEMPIYNWFKISETDDITWILKNREADKDRADSEVLEMACEEMKYEFYDTFGIPESVKRVARIQQKILLYSIRAFRTNDVNWLTHKAIAEQELKQELKNNKSENKAQNSLNSAKVVGYVEKYMGRGFDEKTMSVKKFFTYLKMLEDDIKVKNQENARVNNKGQ